jgi:hypothetical protein
MLTNGSVAEESTNRSVADEKLANGGVVEEKSTNGGVVEEISTNGSLNGNIATQKNSEKGHTSANMRFPGIWE